MCVVSVGKAIELSKESFRAFFVWLQKVVWAVENPDATGSQAPIKSTYANSDVIRFIRSNFPTASGDGAIADVVRRSSTKLLS